MFGRIHHAQSSHPAQACYFTPPSFLKHLTPLSDDVMCGRSLSFGHVGFVFLLVNEFCVRLRTTSYILCDQVSCVGR